MRQSATRRFLVALIFALAMGALVAVWNPMDHVKSDLRADAHGLKSSLKVAAHAIEKTDL
ncbi:hypothetical protein AB2M62_07660 [Sphingomonas sp. MMS12-HWE2-04]|uniref:hypothetical protein n=1 Tax=Sphingomonas sp. MMS12-HWE2-04 TaxID=3234199 RepID=UPI00384D6E91